MINKLSKHQIIRLKKRTQVEINPKHASGTRALAFVEKEEFVYNASDINYYTIWV